jgi:eukaryotic-like serine/threonine-protein kinase
LRGNEEFVSDRDDTQSFRTVEVEETPPPPAGPPPRVLLDDVWPWLAALGLLAVAALLVWLFVFRDSGGTKRTVPAVVGLQQQQAIAKLNAAGYDVRAVREPAKQPRGTVAAQSPGGGSQLPKGATVTVRVSNGRALPAAGTTTAKAPPNATTATDTTTAAPAATTQVPDVTGQDEASAAGQVEAAGLVPETDPAPGSGTAGSVTQQNPAGGGQANAGATVTLAVVTGSSPPAVQIPNVVGESASDARAALANAKLTFKTAYEQGKVGIVLAQSATGSAPAYTQVMLTVGSSS